MKGLIYSMQRNNRGYFLGAAIAFICSAIIGGVTLYLVRVNGGDSLGLGSLFVFILPIVPIIVICEFLARDLERNIRNGFLKYTLSSITRKEFVISQLIVNLICTVIGLLLGLALLGIFRAVCEEMVQTELFGMMAIIALLVSVIQWTVLPLTLLMKSAEKAGITVGLFVGFAVVFPIVLSLRFFDEDVDFIDSYYIISSLMDIKTVLIVISAALIIYAGVFALNIKLLKRGVC